MNTLVAYPAYKNRATNPYQALLYTELERHGWRVLDLDVAARRLMRADVVHLHWPDGFAFHRGLAKTLARSALLLLLLGWYRMRGARVVWTIHNLRSHKRFHPRVEAWFWQRLYRRLDGWIALNQFSAETARGMPVLRSLPHATIPHGLYPQLGGAGAQRAGETEGALSEDQRPTQLLLFGKVRPYKEVPLLVDAFARLPEESARLTIAGQCHDPAIARALQERAAAVPGIRLLLRFIPDGELDALIRAADAVVIPYAGSLNSGVVFLALAYDKPVIVPATPTFEEIAVDFGPRRVHLFDPPLDTHKLRAALECLAGGGADGDGGADASEKSGPQTDPYPIDRYQWRHIAAEHDRFFRRLP